MVKDLRSPFIRFNNVNPYDLFKDIKTPAYVIDEWRLKENGKILKQIEDETGAKILLAQKAFSNFNLYNTLKDYIAGTEASGLFEARLGYEEMPGAEGDAEQDGREARRLHGRGLHRLRHVLLQLPGTVCPSGS